MYLKTLFLIFVVVVTTVPVSADWVTRQGDYNHTGLAGSDIGADIKLLWKKHLVGTYDEFAGPMVVNGTVVTVPKTTETKAYSTYINNQTEKWNVTVGSTDATPSYYNGMIYILNVSGALFSIYENNGTVKWVSYVASSPKRSITTPVFSAADNAVFVSQNANHALYSYDIDTGAENWNTSLNDIVYYPASSYIFGLLYDNGVIYVSGHCSCEGNYSKIAAYYSNNGTLKWRSNFGLGGRGVWDSALLLDNNMLYTGMAFLTNNSMVAAIYPENGTVAWYTPRFNSYDQVFATPVIKNGVLWITANLWVTSNQMDPRKNALLGIYPNNGSIKYEYDFYEGSYGYTSPIATDSYVYTALLGSNKVYVFNHNAELLGTYQLGGNIYSQMALDDNVLYITADDGYLYALASTNKTTVRLAASEPGGAGNGIITAETINNASWGASTLLGGEDSPIVNMSAAPQTLVEQVPTLLIVVLILFILRAVI